MGRCPDCKMCDKVGLPILLTRYAIAPNEAKAPKISGKFKVAPDIALGKETHYTLRMLRPGFIYQCNADGSEWQGYEVMGDGWLMPFDIPESGPKDGSPLPPAGKEKPCEPEKDASVASCIAIPFDKLGTLYFAFSDVAWTKRVWEEIKKAPEKHMRKADLNAWKSADIDHGASILKAGEHVTEYADGVASNWFEFCGDKFIERKGAVAVDRHALAKDLREGGFNILDSEMPEFHQGFVVRPKKPEDAQVQLAICSRAAVVEPRETKEKSLWPYMQRFQIKSKAGGLLLHGLDRLLDAGRRNNIPAEKCGLVLALDDPAGITADIAALINYRFVLFDKPDDQKLIASQAIAAFREAIYRSALHTAPPEMLAEDYGGGGAQTFDLSSEPLKKEMEIQEKSPAYLAWRQSVEWNKYEYKKFDKEGSYYENDALWKEFQSRHPPEENLDAKPKDYRAYVQRQREQFEKGQKNKKERPEPTLRFSEAERLAFENDHKKRLNEFIDLRIRGVAAGHAAWLESQALCDYYDLFFDKNNIQSGLVFFATTMRCFGHTQNLDESGKVYDSWLDGDFHDKTNLLARSLYFNQEDMGKGIKKLIDADVASNIAKAKEITPIWKEVFKMVKKGGQKGLQGKALENAAGYEIEEQIQNFTSYLTAKFSGSLIRKSTETVKKHLIAASFANDLMMRVVDVRGTPSELLELVGRRGQDVIGGINSNMANRLGGFIRKQAEESGSIQLNKIPVMVHFPIRDIDMLAKGQEELAKRAASGVTGPLSDAEAIAMVWDGQASPKVLEQFDRYTAKREAVQERLTKQAAERAAGRAVSTAHSLFKVGIPILTTLQKVISLKSAFEAIESATKKGKPTEEAWCKLFSAGIGSLAGIANVLEITGVIATSKLAPGGIAAVPSKGLAQFSTAELKRAFSKDALKGLPLSKWLGAAAGIALAVGDFNLAGEASAKGQSGLTWAYVASGSAGAIGAIAGLFSVLPVVGAVCFIVSIGASMLIAGLEENDLQEWLYRCVFGRAKSYPKDNQGHLMPPNEVKDIFLFKYCDAETEAAALQGFAS